MTDSAKILSAKLHELTEAPNFTVQVIHNKRVILKKRVQNFSFASIRLLPLTAGYASFQN
jgi:hypothetical protein